MGMGYTVRKGPKSEHKGTYKLAEVTLTTALVGAEGLVKGAPGLVQGVGQGIVAIDEGGGGGGKAAERSLQGGGKGDTVVLACLAGGAARSGRKGGVADWKRIRNGSKTGTEQPYHPRWHSQRAERSAHKEEQHQTLRARSGGRKEEERRQKGS
jgi:hypothetical protein